VVQMTGVNGVTDPGDQAIMVELLGSSEVETNFCSSDLVCYNSGTTVACCDNSNPRRVISQPPLYNPFSSFGAVSISTQIAGLTMLQYISLSSEISGTIPTE